MAFVALSFPGALLAGVPDYSPVALWAAIVLTVGGTISAALAARPGSWWSRLATAGTYPLLFLGLGVRGWLPVTPFPWLWLPLAVGGYLLAWALPVIHPRLSAWLLREQLAPQTRLGRGCLSVLLAMFPLGGISGYWFYEFSRRAGVPNVSLLVIGGLGIFVAITLSQAISEQLWRRRPWAQKAEAEAQAVSNAASGVKSFFSGLFGGGNAPSAPPNPGRGGGRVQPPTPTHPANPGQSATRRPSPRRGR